MGMIVYPTFFRNPYTQLVSLEPKLPGIFCKKNPSIIKNVICNIILNSICTIIWDISLFSVRFCNRGIRIESRISQQSSKFIISILLISSPQTRIVHFLSPKISQFHFSFHHLLQPQQSFQLIHLFPDLHLQLPKLGHDLQRRRVFYRNILDLLIFIDGRS